MIEQLKKNYQGKNILVTGGAGFIGSHLVERLVELGANVTVLDNFSNGSISNLKNVIARINLKYADICFPHVCTNATKNKDLVFHLAALVSVPQSIYFPEICHKINVAGFRNILEGCRKNAVKTVIFSSSCAVYGSKHKPCDENDNPEPLSPYAQSKLECEKMCQEFYQNFGLNTVSLRYFNVYGERQKVSGEYSAVIAKFKFSLENNLPLTIFGDGSQTRDFINVNEVVDANIKIATYENLGGEVLNIASGESISILELIKKLENDLGKKAVEIRFQPARTGDIVYSKANCEKFRKLIQMS